MNTPDCPRTTLVEALRDGRLGPQECASMERHLEGCSACAEFARDLAKIGDAVRAPLERLTPLEHQRSRVALLQKAAAQAPGKTSSNGRAWAFGAVLAAATAILGFAGGSWNSSTNQVAVALHMGALPQFALDAKFGLQASADARFNRHLTADLDELTLDHGTIDVKMPKLAAGKRFVVHAAGAEIEVHSTAFRVEVENGRFRGVAVEQGTVDVQYAGFTGEISAGSSWRSTPGSAEPDKPASKTENDVKAPTENSPERTVMNTTPAPKATTRNVLSRDDGPNLMEPQDKPLEEQAPLILKPTPPAPAATQAAPSPASQTFAEAMAAMRRGDYAGSADKLEQFAETHAGDARADEADYLRAIALQRAGRKEAAIAAAKRYLATRPNGAHRADAARIVGNGK